MAEDFISKRIQQILSERNWSTYRLVKECGCSRNSVYNAVSGEHDIQVSTLFSICEALNITVTEFFHADPETEIVKTEQEKLLLQSFRSMGEDSRLRMMGYVQALADEENRKRDK